MPRFSSRRKYWTGRANSFTHPRKRANHLPPLIRLTRSSGVFHKERKLGSQPSSRVRNSFNDRRLLRPPLVYLETSVLHPSSILFNFIRKKRGDENRWTEFESDSRGGNVFFYYHILDRSSHAVGNWVERKEKKRKGRKSLKGRHSRKTPRGTRVSTSLESERAINHRAANIDWQINPEIGAVILQKRSITIRKMIGLARCGRSAEENSVFDYDQPLFERSFSRLVASKGGGKRGEQNGDSTTN